MAEYINREALLDKLCIECKGFSHKPCPNLTGRCLEYEQISEMPAADVVPVSIGCEYCREDRDGYVKMLGAFTIHKGMICAGKFKPRKINFCPICGAKMDGNGGGRNA